MDDIDDETLAKDFSDLQDERIVIGAILSQGQLVELAMDLLCKWYFVDPAHQAIFEAMETLAIQRIAVQEDAVVGLLSDVGRLEEAGGAHYVSSLIDVASQLDSSDFSAVAERIESKAHERNLVRLFNLVPELVANLDKTNETPEDLSLDGFTVSSGVTTERLTVEMPLQGALAEGHRYAIPSRGFEDAPSIDKYRLDFMKDVVEIVPQVLESLSKNVFPKYLDMQRASSMMATNIEEFVAKAGGFEGLRTQLLNIGFELSDSGTPGMAIVDSKNATRIAPSASYVLTFVESLIEWSRTYQLTERWITEEFALPTLRWWSLTRDFDTDMVPPPLMWHRRPWIAPMDLDSAFKFEFPRWNPEADDWSAYKDRIKRAFDMRLEEYEGKKRAEAKREGKDILIRGDRRRQWKYLVQYQVQNKERNEIYAEAHTEEENLNEERRRRGEMEKPLDLSTVNKAIKQGASLLGIMLRPSLTKPGPHRN